ncbi:MAG: type II toxin-antitoxin system VapC family toxin [bacterium]
MSDYVLDTHTFLYWLLDPLRLPTTVIELLEEDANDFVIPTVVIIEIQYLIEIGRVEARIADVLNYIESTTNFRLHPYDKPSLLKSIEPSKHRDPFDRIILGTAQALKCAVITKDRWMKENYACCIW